MCQIKACMSLVFTPCLKGHEPEPVSLSLALMSLTEIRIYCVFNGFQLKHDNLNGNIKMCLISTFPPVFRTRTDSIGRPRRLARTSVYFVPEIRRLIPEITFWM